MVLWIGTSGCECLPVLSSHRVSKPKGRQACFVVGLQDEGYLTRTFDLLRSLPLEDLMFALGSASYAIRRR